jgi:methylthioribose-1-phosphate isomerase
VAAPLATVDLSTPSGELITIEERNADEVLSFRGVRVAPAGARATNPAFDVTPARLIHAIVTEKGIARPPYQPALAALFGRREVSVG